MLARIVQWFRALWLQVTKPLLLWAVSICRLRRIQLRGDQDSDRRVSLPEAGEVSAGHECRMHVTSHEQVERDFERAFGKLRREHGESILSKVALKFVDPRKLKAAYLNRDNDPTGKLREQAHMNKVIAFQLARDSGTFVDPDHPVITEEEMAERREALRHHKF